eukprot:3231818-Pleurochrysis_carterae.AAC.6
MARSKLYRPFKVIPIIQMLTVPHNAKIPMHDNTNDVPADLPSMPKTYPRANRNYEVATCGRHQYNAPLRSWHYKSLRVSAVHASRLRISDRMA